ncbi:MAG: M20/M25/M40 family metallo-hydrolase, partial [Gammaproteobacteria bacterium]|nr:M20/M25/M40 family metallo-hydrolase [Gammaproteobacteria bacterium]
IRMYSELLGAYPYDKFALVENFWETGYGMPSYTLLGSQIIRFPFILTSSYPHEILHNWWGNSVYVDYATGNWCEGLTAYLADHLLKEGEGLGAEYRRDTLKKYRDYASSSADFPLTEFRSRHSAVTEAVGYGKTLMGFHMLRRQVGDAAFRQGLATFYKEYRGQRASWAHIETAFEKASGQDLSRFFSDLTTRVGAANLAVSDVRVRGRKGRYTVTGTLRQLQDRPYALEVPVVISTTDGLLHSVVASAAGSTPFSVETTAEPKLVAIDPEFDLFRVLDPRETAPSIGQLFGAGKVTAVLPSASPAEAQAWRDTLFAWQSPSRDIAIVMDTELAELPADRAVWLLGRQNRLAAGRFTSEPAVGLALSATGVAVNGAELPYAGHAHVLTRRHPSEPKLALAWITADADTVGAIVRKLPHYGKYSWLSFEGAEANNVAKGEWPVTDSPLLVNLARKGAPAVLTGLPRRAPLATPPATFSAARLMEHVTFLAAAEREGRGFDTAGLDDAAEYIRAQFAAAGLEPGGDNGGWFQSFKATGGRGQKERTLRNVIAVLPGANPEFRDQAALMTAHYDHLGYGWPGGRADSIGQLHPGADDNASGVAVLLEVARQMAAGVPPPRTVVFVAFSGEEAGLMGSRHYAGNAIPVPASGIFGVINMDTVGHLGDQPLSILAAESAREWPFVFSGITAVSGIPTRTVPGASQSSDQQSFIDVGIPGVQLFTAATLDYHRPTDTADKVDGAGLARVAAVAREAIGYLSSTDKRLTVTGAGAGAAANAGPGTGPSRRVSLGAIPDFAFQGAGLRLEGVVPDSPAAKAGMKPGDVITRMGGAEVRDLGTFNAELRKYQPGDRVPILWTSGDKANEAEVELAAR